MDDTTPRTSAPPYQLERALLIKLAGLSAATWRRIYRWLGARLFGMADAPVELLDDVADRTAEALGRFRRSDPTDEPAATAEAWTRIDPDLLVASWRRFKESGLPSEDTIDEVDAAGRPVVAHYCLDRHFGLVVAPSDGRGPSTLMKIIRVAPSIAWWNVGVPLAVYVEGSLHPFTYVRAGAVLGEIAIGELRYLLAGISAHLAILEITPSGRRVVWCGRAEHLSGVELRRPQDLEGPTSPPSAPPPDGSDVEAERQAIAELHQQLAALTADHSAMKQQLQVEQTERAEAEACLDVASSLVKLMTAAMAMAASELSAAESMSEEAEGLADPPPRAIAEERSADAERDEEVEELRRRSASLRDEIEALRAAAAERAAMLEEENDRLVDELAEIRATAEGATTAVGEVAAAADPGDLDHTGVAEELRAARQQLAEERYARLAAEQEALRTHGLLEEKAAALAAIEAARASLVAEVATIRGEAEVALAEARDQLAEERIAHAATRDRSEEVRPRLAEIEAELAAVGEALPAAEDALEGDEERVLQPAEHVDDDETVLAEEARPPDEADAHNDSIVRPPGPADVEQLLTTLAELDPEHLADYQRLAASPDLPMIARMAQVMFHALARTTREDMSALKQRIDDAERAVARAKRNAPKHPQKGRKKKSRR